MWENKKILIGVTGGIAAYKVTLLVRLFIKAGADVKVIMTEDAKQFITPLTLSTLSKNPVYSSFYKSDDAGGEWNNHVELALWADIFIIAPATANTIFKIANGACNNLLMATYLSATCPVYIAPAMDLDMYQHPSQKQNFELVESYGNIIIPAESGELASGLVGQGRMAEPEHIFDFISSNYHYQIKEELPLIGKTVLITAGPTYEAIDPVRFIGNHSSGKMGFSIAKTAADLGAKVYLITGPTALEIKHKNIEIKSVVSAHDMYTAVHDKVQDMDIVIMSAAVADYTPKFVGEEKIKKKTQDFKLELVKTKDILASVGAIKTKQFLVGFALETENEVENAKGKLKSKNLDMIVLNSLRDEGAGFATDTNKVTFIDKEGGATNFDLKPKEEVAKDILNFIIEKYA